MPRSEARSRSISIDRELQAAARAPDAEAVGLEGEGADAGHLLDKFVDLAEDLLLRAFTLRPLRKLHDDEAAIGLAL